MSERKVILQNKFPVPLWF